MLSAVSHPLVIYMCTMIILSPNLQPFALTEVTYLQDFSVPGLSNLHMSVGQIGAGACMEGKVKGKVKVTIKKNVILIKKSWIKTEGAPPPTTHLRTSTRLLPWSLAQMRLLWYLFGQFIHTHCPWLGLADINKLLFRKSIPRDSVTNMKSNKLKTSLPRSSLSLGDLLQFQDCPIN